MAMISIGGVSLNVEEKGQGEVLLLVHGFPLDHSMWWGQLEGPSKHYRVIAPDLRGFGKSDVTEGTVTMEQFAEDLARLLDGLNIAEPITLCGLSMGGYIAWQFALNHSNRLKRLIVCDTRAVADSKDTAAGREKSAEKVVAEGAVIVADIMQPKLFHQSSAGSAYVEQTRQVMLGTNPLGIAAALRGMAKRPDVTGQLEQIRVPTLVICGEHDAISPTAEMRKIAEAIPHARYVEIPAAGHMAPLEKPEEVNAAIVEFMNSASR
jgi:3-oxoadipate enol-lactonase